MFAKVGTIKSVLPASHPDRMAKLLILRETPKAQDTPYILEIICNRWGNDLLIVITLEIG